jgi:hypothetical protein
MATYSKSSPWADTLITANNLDFLAHRPILPTADDPLYEIETQYTYRPDLLSYELYNTPKLWWVFMHRNLDVMQDPIFDFVPGKLIYLPIKPNLFKDLNL